MEGRMDAGWDDGRLNENREVKGGEEAAPEVGIQEWPTRLSFDVAKRMKLWEDEHTPER
jgi:hypothetical protein